MRKAWKIWHQGEENVFAGEEGIFCHIYSVLEFEHKGLVIEEFDDYLLTVQIPSGKSSYMEYFTPFVTDDTEGIQEPLEKFEQEKEQRNIEKPKIYTDQKYMVTFRIAKGKDKIPLIFTNNVQEEEAAGVVAGILRGVGSGALTGVGTGQMCNFLAPAVGVFVCGVVGGVVGAVVGGTVGTVTYLTYDGSDPQDYAASIALLPYKPEVIEQMSCEYTPIGGSEVLRD